MNDNRFYKKNFPNLQKFISKYPDEELNLFTDYGTLECVDVNLEVNLKIKFHQISNFFLFFRMKLRNFHQFQKIMDYYHQQIKIRGYLISNGR